MAIEVQCNNCFATYRVKEERAGTRIRCKDCGKSILVDDADDFGEDSAPRPHRSSQKSRGPSGRKRQQAGLNKPLVIGGGIAALVVVFGIVLVAVMVFSKPGEVPGEGGGDGQDGGAVGVWKVTADPSPSTKPFGEASIGIDIPSKSTFKNVVYPATPSDFVAIGSNSQPDDIREIWNLRTGKKVGTIHTDVGTEKGALSPDGKHFAALAKSKDKLLLFDVAADKQIAELPLDGGSLSPALQFAGPNRLVRIKQGQPISVWSIPSGDLETTIDAPKYLQAKSLAVSGGGQFIAFAGRNEPGKLDDIRIFDLDEGELAGVISVANLGVTSNLTCTGLSFSPDGRELAGVFRTYEMGGKNWLIGWDMTNGKEAFQHDVDAKLRGKAVSGTNDSPDVRWFPNQKWLFLFGAFVFDHEAGGPIWSVPADKERSGAAASVLSDDRVLVVSGPYNKRSIRTIVLPRDEIANAAAAVSSGGLAEDAGLPPLTQANSDGAKVIDLKGAVSSWKVQPDPAEQPGATFFEQPIPISTPACSIGSVLISAADTARAVVSLDRGEDKAVIECYDLTTSTKQADFEIAFGCKALSISPEGTHLLTRKKGSQGRLDIWTIPDGKHVAGWRPFRDESSDKSKVTAATFIDAAHVMTLSAGRKLTVWEVPAARALYTIENFNQRGAVQSWEYSVARSQRGISDFLSGVGKSDESESVQDLLNPGLPTVSPGGKYLALLQGDQITLLNSATGDIVGVLAVKGGLGAAAFHPSGERLAVTLKRPSGGWFTSWNLNDGKVEHEFPLPTLGTWLHWCDDSRLLLDNSKLIDIDREMIVWSYQSANAIHAAQSPDGRHTALMQQSAQSNQLSLAAIKLPDATAAAKLAGTFSKPAMVLEPGKKITLQFKLTAKPPNNASFESDVTKRMEKYFTAAGISVAGGQPLTVVVSTTNKSTGESMEFRTLGNIGAAPTVVQEKLIVCRIAVQRGSKVLWNHESTFNNVKFGLTRIKQGETIQQNLLEQQWSSVQTFFSNFEPPVHVFPRDAQNGIGQSALTATSN
jgi:WD40 repeat protein